MAPPPRRAVSLRSVACAALVLVLAGPVGGCTVGPSQRPPVAVRGDDMAPPAPAPAPEASPVAPETLPDPEPQNATLPFVDCDAVSPPATPVPPDRTLRVECAELFVPADPDRPTGPLAALRVLRVGLTDAPADRPPLLALGDSAGQPSARHALELAGQVSVDVLERFTLIGLDRRGAGTDELDCAPAAARAALVDADPAETGEAELTALLEQARAVVQECTVALDGGLARYRTSTTAADVETLRGELGVGRLSAIGTGDGAAALAVWARSAPRAVGRLVLDGPPDPGLDEPALTEARAAGADAAFTAFAVACGAQPGCPLGADPRRFTISLVEGLRTRPLVTVDGRRLTAGAAVAAVLHGLGEPREWPALAAALAAATAGDPAPLLGPLEPAPEPGVDGELATACNDTRRRVAPAEISALATRLRTDHPLFGGTLALRLVACAPWPTDDDPVAGSLDGVPPLLVLGTAADPRGGLEASRRAAESLPSARFVSWQGAGTGAYPRTACISTVVDALLLQGIAPPGGALCPP